MRRLQLYEEARGKINAQSETSALNSPEMPRRTSANDCRDTE